MIQERTPEEKQAYAEGLRAGVTLVSHIVSFTEEEQTRIGNLLEMVTSTITPKEPHEESAADN